MSALSPFDLQHFDLRHAIGLGVAGNFTGHLEQAGEASDFVGVEVDDAAAPKGLFPFYVPGHDDSYLGTYPLTSDRIAIPPGGGNLQIEPEVALLCALEYESDEVISVDPRGFAAYNDCSIRRPGAKKISEKKNWGPNTKGLADTVLAIDSLEPGGPADRFRLACFLRRDGELHDYGQDSPLPGYSYFHERLLTWIAEKMRSQRDGGPLEDIKALVDLAKHPAHAVISVGATRYTDFGERTFLEAGDEALVLVYDAEAHPDPKALVVEGAEIPVGTASLLRQRVG